MCDMPTWQTSEWWVVYVSLQAGHGKRVWVGWVTTKLTDCAGRRAKVGGAVAIDGESARASLGAEVAQPWILLPVGLR